MASPEEGAALCCPRGHELHLTHLPDLRKRLCSHCKDYIPRKTPRYSCRWCAYNVCYGCAAQFPIREWKKQSGREAVAISKYYDIVAPRVGEMRQHCHSRKGFAISEDCRSPEFDTAHVTLRSPDGDDGAAPGDPPAPHCQLAADVLRRGVQLTDVVRDEVDSGYDCLDRDWRPELPEYDDGGGCVRGDSMLSWLLGGGNVAAKIGELSTAAREVLEQQPVVSEVTAPAKVFGDIHGQLRDMLLLFHFYGQPGQASSETITSAESFHVGGMPSNQRPVWTTCSQTSQSRTAAREGFRVQRTSSSSVWDRLHSSAPTRSLTSLMQRTFTGTLMSSIMASPVREVSYVFNGDWVDRGYHQLEVVVLLFAFKIMFPGQVWLTRGNHEDRGQNIKTSLKGSLGFDKACLQHFDGPIAQQVFDAFHETFDWLPLAARIEGRILVLHGGLGKGDWTLDMMRSVERPLPLTDMTSELGNMVYNVLWSDPLAPDRKKPVETFGVHSSHRTRHKSIMATFGRDVTESFCMREGIDLVIRSHQFKQWGKGYELMHDGLLMRVFSARNYCGSAFNDGGILLIGYADNAPGKLLVRPQNVERMAHPKRVKRMNSLGLPEPFCPNHHLMQLVSPRPAPGWLSLGCVFKRELDNVECNVCGAEELETGCYFACRGCIGYDMCLDCACRLAGDGVQQPNLDKDTSSVIHGRSAEPDSDSDDGTSSPLSAPTLLTGRAARALRKPR
uniref:Serine/threonine specific protein phosphatases domain-containing protein n=1 Tax=Alexandrium monilatum TaxID=311494 RepID=A0A7S4Q813_9DINO